MKEGEQERRQRSEDDFWTERLPLLTAQFPTYDTKLQQVHGRFHTSEETFRASPHEIIPLHEKTGTRTYVMMQPYVLEPQLAFTIGLSHPSKTYHDQESPIGEVIGSKQEGFRDVQVGNAQAWYYHSDKTIVLWECFVDKRFRTHPLGQDTTMQNLWQAFEHYLVKKFPNAQTLATPFNDPIADSMEEYQAFLQSLSYAPLGQAAFGKALTRK
jgi:hypothetical protein